MTDTPWFKFYASDWLAGTRGLTPAETGVYITLIAMIYENGGPIERYDRRLARLCNCAPGGFAKVIAALIEQRKLIEIDGRLTNARAEKEMDIRSNRSEKARDSAENRWRKPRVKPEKNQGEADANAMRRQCDGNANQRPEARDQKERENGEPDTAQPFEVPDRTAEQDRFPEFWTAYPKREGKAAAQAAFITATSHVNAEWPAPIWWPGSNLMHGRLGGHG
jgi:uncharacterized protein YdaU (DUF1376 family)